MNVHIHQGKKVQNLQIENAKRIIEVLRERNIQISAPCGGGGTCGKCHVRTDGSQAPSPADTANLSLEQIAEGRRLSCCTDIYDDLHIFIDETHEAVIQVDGVYHQTTHNPPVTVKEITISAPSLNDPKDYWERIEEQISIPSPNLSVLQNIDLARNTIYHIVLFDQSMPLTIINTNIIPYGIAFDIGTTTVVGYLIDLTSGKTVDTISELNSQHSYGADVISRANYAATRNGLDELTSVMRTQINTMIDVLSKRNSVCTDTIFHLSFVGNTIMMHLLLNLPVKQITVLPFTPLVTRGLDLSAKELDFSPKHALVSILPSISGFVGADTVAAILACNIEKAKETSLLVDIGTNGEIVLSHDNHLYCCSAAAGPAFEGAHISCGMGGIEGAISHVRTHENILLCEVIGEGKALGICGSGLVDAVAVLLEQRLLDETGHFEDEVESDNIVMINDQPAFRLTSDVYITQKDIREVQLAKAAIAAGIDILLKEAKIHVEQIRHVYLAGGFGNHIDPASACKIGILPKDALPYIHAVGNAAGSGARAALLEQDIRTRASSVRTSIKYIELSARADFQDRFIEHMIFD